MGVKDMEYAIKRTKDWEQWWKSGIPFSAIVAREPGTNEFLGYMVLGGAERDEPNSSEIAGLIRHDKWEKLYGTKAMVDLMNYAWKLYSKRAKLPNGQVFKRV